VRGQEVLLGLNTVVLEYRHNGAVRTQWKAPSLNCETIKFVEELITDGKVTDRFERIAVKIDLGEPSAHLFHVPLEYAEKSPSQRALMATPDGRVISPRVMETLKREDVRYYSSLERARNEGRLSADLMRILNDKQTSADAQ
jgi:hypothetical protein